MSDAHAITLYLVWPVALAAPALAAWYGNPAYLTAAVPAAVWLLTR